MTDDIGARYLDEARRSLRGNKRLAEGALAQISDEEFFRAPDQESNSIAVIVKHIAGNARARFTDFLSTDGEKPWRHRDTEFEIDKDDTRASLMEFWEAGYKIAFDTIASLKPEDLKRTVTIRGAEHSVLQAIHRATAHYAYHIGQIVFLAKHWRGREWKTLSIPRGKSDEAGQEMEQKLRERAK
ncbi:MAG: DUF1572 domain-containing protein [Acidobacteriia bacterium]|nr:DUF1572 domain-containing protein [Terriglobia bacterium]